jgi:phospholipid/cholesterol/gamma-HCH transport system permease protein
MKEFSRQLDMLGVQSSALIIVAGLVVGVTLSVKSFIITGRFGATTSVGGVVVYELAVELGPLLCALIVAGRVVASVASELGTMRRQLLIDALWVMGIHPVQHLVVPRVLSMVVMLPMLTIVFDFSAMLGSFVTCVYYLGIDQHAFMLSVQSWVSQINVAQGLIKAVLFGLTISLIACSEGYNAPRSEGGVGIATARAVMISCVSVLVLDCFVSSVLFWPG